MKSRSLQEHFRKRGDLLRGAPRKIAQALRQGRAPAAAVRLGRN